MTHVSREDLNALIDGALTGNRESEAKKIQEHLDGCEGCRSLLEEERENCRIASEIVASAVEVPSEILEAFPSFEDLKARAETEKLRERASARRRAPAQGARPWLLWQNVRHASHRLQLAAAIALSLGGGWMIRGATVAPRLSPLVPMEVVSTQTTLAPIPGLAVQEVSHLGGSVPAVLIVQELLDGRTVEVFHVSLEGYLDRMDEPGDVLQEVRDLYASDLLSGWNMVIRESSSAWSGDFSDLIILRASVSEAELIELADGIVPTG